MKCSNGCWTCRLRRKKCDEEKPVCSACASLHIQCHVYQHDKPDWMDGGVKQAKMLAQIKREIKAGKVHRRLYRGQSIFQASTVSLDPGLECHDRKSQDRHDLPTLDGSDLVLTSFFLDKAFPFLFPFYAPSLSQGGKAWILELILKRRPIRQAILCQSRYFTSVCGTDTISYGNSEEVLAQTKSDVFQILREGLRQIGNEDFIGNPRGAVRVITCIMQLHRLEITILSYKNWQTHLDAVVGLFKQLLDNHRNFKAIIDRLDPPLTLATTQNARFPTAEHAAFRFSSGLLIMDDIIASTTLQRQPKLYSHYRSLLYSDMGDEDSPPIDIEAVFGIKNWLLLQLGEVATLNAWKMDCEKAEDMDVIQLAHRASAIEESLIANLTELSNKSTNETIQPLDNLSPFDSQLCYQRILNTRIWTHATLLYLFAVTSGWQLANENVRYHVNQVIELLTCGTFKSDLLHTVIWPFCVAGFLTIPAQESQFRQMVIELEPRLFGKLHKALEIIEGVWKDRSTRDCDLSTRFSSLDDPILLV